MSLTENMDKGRLPFRCPNRKCGKKGWVPLGQLDRQLMCRACRSRFYLDPIGKEMVLGDRPATFINHLYLAPPKKYKPDLIERTAKGWSALSLRQKVGIKAGMGIVALLLVALVVRPMFRGRPKFPKDLAARSMVVVKALGTNDRDRLAEIAAPGTEGDAGRWLAAVRPKSWPKGLVVLQAEASVLYQNPHKGRACVAVEIAEPTAPFPAEAQKTIAPANVPEEGQVVPEEGEAAPVPEADAAEPEAQAVAEVPKPVPPKRKIRLFWVLAEGQWLFDGTETLKAAKIGD